MGVPIEESRKPEFEEWYRRVDSKGMVASTILLYAGHLKRLLEHALTGRGLSEPEAEAGAKKALSGIPIRDLHKEVERYELWLDKLMTLSELAAIIGEAKHPRARAFVPVLYESGCRKGELLAARIRDVTIGEVYSKICVFGKTGMRALPLVRSVPALEAWLEVHPDPRPDMALFAAGMKLKCKSCGAFGDYIKRTKTGCRCKICGKNVDGRMDERTPNRLLEDLCGRTGIRRVTPHMLRHTRLTELAAAGVGEYILKSFAGWKPDSRMAAKYIHFSGRTHIPSILRLEGIAVDEVSPDSPRSITEVYGALGRILGEAER